MCKQCNPQHRDTTTRTHGDLSHHQFIKEVAAIAVKRLNAEDADKCQYQLSYGIGRPNLRGVTYYDVWEKKGERVPFVEVCAAGQSDPVQLAGTTIHEIGHVLAGHAAGHSKDWKQACAKLGLNSVKAVGTVYTLDMFTNDIRHKVEVLIEKLERENPAFRSGPAPRAGKPAPCPAGIGTKGGTSRGTGSGSRMLKLDCLDCGAVWRMSGKWAEGAKACPCCGTTNINKPA